jgi:hypothetical protein
MKFLWVFLMSIVSCGVTFGQIESGLVTLVSKYADELDATKTAEIKGSGFLVENQGRFFVFTASHVSQGKSLEIQYQGASLAIKARLYDGIHDFEILEVDPTGLSLVASFVYKKPYFVLKSNPSIDLYRRRWVDAYNFMPLNDWVNDPTLEQDNLGRSQRVGVLQCDFYCRLLSGNALVQPGASGSPLVATVPTEANWTQAYLPFDIPELIPIKSFDANVLRGVAIRRDRFFARSSFVPVKTVQKIFEAFLAGETTHAFPQSTWKVSKSLMFRRTGGGLQESLVVSGSSGNGSSIDGGDWEKLREDFPAQVLSEISAFPVNSIKTPVFQWLYMARNPLDRSMISSYVWFDMEHYLPHSNFVFGTDADHLPQIDQIHFRAGDRKVGIDGKSELTATADKVRVSIALEQGADLRFEILKSDPFVPFKEIKASDSSEYIVDLRSLYMVNPATSYSQAYRDPRNRGVSPDQWEKVFYQEQELDFSTLKVFYRKKRSSPENLNPLNVDQGKAQEMRF